MYDTRDFREAQYTLGIQHQRTNAVLPLKNAGSPPSKLELASPIES